MIYNEGYYTLNIPVDYFQDPLEGGNYLRCTLHFVPLMFYTNMIIIQSIKLRGESCFLAHFPKRASG